MHALNNVLELIQKRQYKQALKSVKSINDTTARSFDSLQLQGVILNALSRHKDAIAAFQRAMSMASTATQKAHIIKSVGKIQLTLNNNAEAMRLFEQTVALTPGDIECVRLLCQSLQELMLLEKLKAYANAILKHHPDDVEMHRHLLLVGTEQNDRALAEQSLSKLIALKESMTIRKLASLYSSAIKVSVDKAEELAKYMQANEADNEQISAVFLAEIALINKDYEKVVDLLPDEYIAQLPSWFETALVYNQRAKAFDKLSRFDDAFADFEKMNELSKTRLNAELEDTDLKNYQKMDLSGFTFDYQGEREFELNHVFMVGFPRSGTTLLENILNTQKSIYTLDEKVAIPSVSTAFSILGKKYPQDLDTLTDEEIKRLRSIYFSVVSQYSGDLNQYDVLVDKLPSNLVQLPLINKVFPEAKVIVSIRNPLDAGFSCFSQLFKPNTQMNYFQTLEGTYKRYSDIFTQLELWKQQLPIELMQYRYEDLTADFDTVAKSIFAFIGVEPDDSYREFNQHASKRIINTPSRDQVKEGIYQSAKGKWMNYEQYINPFKHHVDKFLTLYGFQ